MDGTMGAVAVTVTVAVAVEDRLVREGIGAVLRGLGYRVVAEGTVADLRGEPAAARVVLLDTRSREGQALARARAAAPMAKVLFLGAGRPGREAAALGCGADGCLGDDVTPAALAAAVSQALEGQATRPAAPGPGGPRRPGHATQGNRLPERELLACLARGESDRAIAAIHGVSHGAVRSAVKTLLRRLKVHNRTQAAVWAMANKALPQPGAQP